MKFRIGCACRAVASSEAEMCVTREQRMDEGVGETAGMIADADFDLWGVQYVRNARCKRARLGASWHTST